MSGRARMLFDEENRARLTPATPCWARAGRGDAAPAGRCGAVTSARCSRDAERRRDESDITSYASTGLAGSEVAIATMLLDRA